jgi:2-polyprenyl-3-methyl-5-hydroxy-6-metoxy-1,4-benzoquinol methylase
MKREDFRQQRQPIGFLSAIPLPTPEQLRDYYQQHFYLDATVRPATYQDDYDADEIAHRRLMASQHLFALSEQLPSPHRRLLDVGCGEGFVLAAADQAGWTVEGLDFTDVVLRKWHPSLADRMRTGDAFELLRERAEACTQYDAVILNNVLEHVIDPIEMLDLLRRIIAPGGVFLFTVPNDDSQLQGLLKQKGAIEGDYWFGPPGHLHYFNIETARRLATNCRWEEVDCYAGFPIELFLLHPGSNYIRERAAGRAAHLSRIAADLLMAQSGMVAFHRYSQALAGVGMGRVFSMILRPGN